MGASISTPPILASILQRHSIYSPQNPPAASKINLPIVKLLINIYNTYGSFPLRVEEISHAWLRYNVIVWRWWVRGATHLHALFEFVDVTLVVYGRRLLFLCVRRLMLFSMLLILKFFSLYFFDLMSALACIPKAVKAAGGSTGMTCRYQAFIGSRPVSKCRQYIGFSQNQGNIYVDTMLFFLNGRFTECNFFLFQLFYEIISQFLKFTDSFCC